MSILTRSDGTQFVIQAYRELIKYKKKSVAAQRIKDIAEQQGQFVRLFKNHSGTVEAVFSSEPGYLLGESVKQYFQQAKNLIFCEKLKDSQQNLLVIVKEGKVFTDTIINNSQIKAELLPLTSLKTSFQIVVSPDAPLTQDLAKQTNECYLFPEKYTQSFELIHAPLLPRLPSVHNVRLLPLQLALKAEGLSNKSFISSFVVLLIAVISLISVMVVTERHRHPKPARQTTLLTTIDPYSDYLAALNSPSPTHKLTSTLHFTEAFYHLAGWKLLSVKQQGSLVIAEVNAEGGTLTSLQLWANQHNVTLQLSPEGVTLQKNLQLPPRDKPDHIYSLNTLTEFFVDAVSQQLPNFTITILSSTTKGHCRVYQLQIVLKNASPQQIMLLSHTLTNLPAVLDAALLNLDSNGLFSGTINLSLWGANT